jgi:hypothetical protein
MTKNVKEISMVPVPDKHGHRVPKLRIVSAFFFNMIYRLSFHGLPCPCCDGDSTDIHPPPRMLSTTVYLNDRERLSFCPNCDAMVCDACANRIIERAPWQEVQCKWCTKPLHPINRKFLTYADQQDDPSFRLYSLAEKNIKGILRDWMNAMYKTYLGDYLSKNFWTPLMETIGWRFFVDLDFLVETQHKRQFELLMSNMAMRKRHQHPRQRLLDSSYTKFKTIPKTTQVFYKQCRTNAINHGLSTVLISRLTKNFPSPKCFSILGEYVSSEFAKKLAVGLGICKIESRQENPSVIGDQMDDC